MLIFTTAESRVLGFLRALISIFTNYDITDRDWIDIYTEARTFDYSSCSITQFNDSLAEYFRGDIAECLKSFILIIDEFPSSLKSYQGTITVFEASMARNIARAVFLPCLIMGTNTQVANIVGESLGYGSGGNFGRSLWCTVVTRLPETVMEFIENEYDLTKILSIIESSFDEQVGPDICHFLMSQIKSSRPGISGIICVALQTMIDLNEGKIFQKIPALDFLNELAFRVKIFMLARKPSMNKESSIPGHLEIATNNMIQLFGSAAVDSASLINDHLFYLDNPVNSTNMFQLFIKRSAKIEFYTDNNSNYCWIPTSSIPPPCEEVFTYFSSWGYFQTSDQWVSLKSITQHFSSLWKNRDAKKVTRQNTLAPSNDGDVGEHLAHILVIFSSHMEGLGGIGGLQFIEWLIKNSIEDLDNIFDPEWKLVMHGNLELFLNSFKVSYLGPRNEVQGWPLNLCTLNMKRFGIHLGRDRGTRNAERIDSVFEIFPNEYTNTIQFTGKFEVKMWASNVKPELLKSIIIKNAPKLINERVFSLIFCQSASAPKYFSNSGEFKKICKNLGVDVYLVEKENNLSCKIINLFCNNAKKTTPSMVCLILPFLFSTTIPSSSKNEVKSPTLTQKIKKIASLTINFYKKKKQ